MKGTLYWKKHHPSDETLNRGPDSLWSLKIPGCPSKKSRGVTPVTSPLASDHHGLLIIPIHWLASSLCLLSTNKLVCGGRSGALWLPSHHPGGCCTLVVDEEIAPLLCKALWVSRKALYKCNKLLLLIIAHGACSPVLSFHSLWWFGVQCHLLVLVHCVFWKPTSLHSFYQYIWRSCFLPHPTDITDIAPPPTTRLRSLWTASLSSGSDQRRISGCGTGWLLAGPDSLPLWLCRVCAFVLLRCFSCSHTALPKELSLGVIFFSSLSSCYAVFFFNSTCISLLIILCMIVYVTNNKEPWTFWSTSCFLLLTSFLKMLISFSSRIWHLPTLPKAPKVG